VSGLVSRGDRQILTPGQRRGLLSSRREDFKVSWSMTTGSMIPAVLPALLFPEPGAHDICMNILRG
jgi:hypothetical protein